MISSNNGLLALAKFLTRNKREARLTRMNVQPVVLLMADGVVGPSGRHVMNAVFKVAPDSVIDLSHKMEVLHVMNLITSNNSVRLITVKMDG